MNTQLIKSLADAKLLSDTITNTGEDLQLASPWYVKILLAFSGWLAASFMLGFLGSLFSRFYRNTPLLIGLGATLIIGAFFLLRNKKANEFLEHLALAISLAGQALLLVASFNTLKYQDPQTIWLLVGLVQLPLAIFMPNFVHRVFSAFLATIAFASSLYYFQESISGIIIYSAIIMLITALIWLNEFNLPKHLETLQAIGYGLVLALITIKGTNIFMHTDIWSIRVGSLQHSQWFQPWMGELLLSTITLFVVWKLLQKSHPKPTTKATILALGGALVLTLLSMQAQGLMTGVMIVLLGFSASNRVLIGLGVIALLFFISSYYYLLQNTLLDKSITLLILGITLIIGRFIMLKLLPEETTMEGAL